METFKIRNLIISTFHETFLQSCFYCYFISQLSGTLKILTMAIHITTSTMGIKRFSKDVFCVQAVNKVPWTIYVYLIAEESVSNHIVSTLLVSAGDKKDFFLRLITSAWLQRKEAEHRAWCLQNNREAQIIVTAIAMARKQHFLFAIKGK